MTDGPDKIQFTLYLTQTQLDALDRIRQRNGIGRQSLIRLAVHNFLLSQDSTYRLNQQDEQPTDEAA